MTRDEIINKWTQYSNSTNSKTLLKQTCFDALDYAQFNGLLTRDKNYFRNGNNKVLNVAPLALIPSNYEKSQFYKAMDLQIIINKMISNLSNLSDEKFNNMIQENLIPYLEPRSNEFVIKLMNLQTRISEQKKGFKDYGSMGILRSDYMIDTRPFTENPGNNQLSPKASSQSEANTYSKIKAPSQINLPPLASPENQQLCLIEINTMAAGLGSHGSDHMIGKFHNFTNKLISSRLDIPPVNRTVIPINPNYNLTDHEERMTHCSSPDLENQNQHQVGLNSTNDPNNSQNKPRHSCGVPENKMLNSIVNGFEAAYNLYLKKSKSKNIPVILFVVEEQTWNAFDQRGHEFAIREKLPDIDVIRYDLPTLDNKIQINKNGNLFIKSYDDDFYHEVAIVYFRAGYDPSHYPEGKGWLAREMIERSNAIKCPNLKTHILTLKKVQFDLSTNVIDLKKDLKLSETEGAHFKSTVVDQIYIMPDNYENNKEFQKRLNNLEHYVLKPMTEGGSQIYTGSDILSVLKSERKDPNKKDKGYILMKRIFTDKPVNIMLMGNLETDYIPVETSNELGIFGTFVADDTGYKIFNESSGYIMRTKYANLLYGGFASATNALDSINLI